MSGENRFARLAERLQGFFFLVGLCALTVLALELGVGAAFALRDALAPSTEAEIPVPATRPAYADTAYDPALLFRELRAAHDQMYVPYLVWRQHPMEGELVGIDARGERITHFGADDEDALRVWVFGGSAIWGLGAPDAETIPSQLARLFNREWGLPTRVRNLGEVGFVSTQELVALTRELQRGRRPDFVVFLGGVNDAPAAALWPEVPGAHMSFYELRQRFESRDLERRPWLPVVQSLAVVRLARGINQRLGRGEEREGLWDPPEDEGEIRRRGEQAARIWLTNERLVAALGRHFGFEHLFFLQPSLAVGEKPLHPSEASILASEMEDPIKSLSMDVYRRMRELVGQETSARRRSGRVVDLGDAFASVSQPVYFDYAHVSGAGNDLLASQIGRSIRETLCRRQAALDRGPRTAAALASTCQAGASPRGE